ncbi:hypothetical protein [Streptacidiphilus sp. EB129]|uniref:hypothetical protein n=1 Tax=Streptacidiphilus sp. EB129 TaxID=3156262 RepID=UPI0035165967
MTLDDLRAELTKLDHLPGDTIVVMSKDGEGNGFSPLAQVEDAMYRAETTWSGEHYLTEEQVAADPEYGEDDLAPDDAVPAVFLWPTN